MKKATLNYWVDLVIGVAFAISAISGMVFLLPIEGFTVLGVGLLWWSKAHTWSSLAMIAGVVAHLLLHRKWIACMTRQEVLKGTSAPASGEVSVGRRRLLRTTGIVGLAAVATAVLGRTLRSTDEPVEASFSASDLDAPTAWETATSVSMAEPTAVPAVEAQPSVEAVATEAATPEPATSATATEVPSTPSATSGAVACPRGVRYDPYPGRCRMYRDRDGDGYCDLSVPSS